MIVTTLVSPNQKVTTLTVISQNNLLIKIKARPRDNEANFAVQKILADHFHLPLPKILLKNGARSKTKTWIINP